MSPQATVERPKAADPKLAQEIERARAAGKARQAAPAISMTELARTIPRKVAMKQHLERNGYNGAEWHGMWGDAAKHDQYLDEGYVPVLDINGRHAVEGGDKLYALPRPLYDKGIALAAASSRRQLRQTDAKEGAAKVGAEPSAVEEEGQPQTVKGTRDEIADAARKAQL